MERHFANAKFRLSRYCLNQISQKTFIEIRPSQGLALLPALCRFGPEIASDHRPPRLTKATADGGMLKESRLAA